MENKNTEIDVYQYGQLIFSGLGRWQGDPYSNKISIYNADGVLVKSINAAAKGIAIITSYDL